MTDTDLVVSAVPAIIDALVQLAADHADTDVVDGYRVGEGYPDDELLIGIQDPYSQTSSQSAQSSQEWAYLGVPDRDERGTITCAIAAYNHDSTQEAQAETRSRAYAILNRFVAAILGDLTVGVKAVVPGLQWIKPGDDITFIQDQDENETVSLIIFRLAFYAQVP